jgi:chorismate mutase
MNDEIQKRRDRIDEIDSQLLRLLNERMGLVAEVGVIKKRMGLPIRDHLREDEVRFRLREQNHGPFDEESVLKIFELIISESCRIEVGDSGQPVEFPTLSDQV